MAKQYVDLTDITLYDELIKEYIADHGGGASSLTDLSDTNISSPTNNQILKYNSTSGKWENGNGGGGGASALSDLTDTNISTPTSGQVLKYDGSEWDNASLSSSDVGLGNVPNVATNDQTPTFTEASTRANIASGESVATLFGKIKKFFTDLKTVAFTGSYTDLTDKPTIPDVTGKANLSDLAYDFDIDTNYFPGDFVIYDHLVYRCIHDHLGAWNSSNFVHVTVGDAINANTNRTLLKADKVTNPTSGNFAGLDSNGNLTDSGSKASDFLTSHQDISGKADKVTGATNGNLAGLDSNGNITDSGRKAGVLQINPSDATFKSTPGAIWIETA